MFRCKKHYHQGAHCLSLAKVTAVKMSYNTLMWSIWQCGHIYCYLVLVSVCVCVVCVCVCVVCVCVVCVCGVCVCVCVWHWSESD